MHASRRWRLWRALRFSVAALVPCGFLWNAPSPAATAEPSRALAGYTPASSANQRNWEQKFRAIPDSARIRATVARLASVPHHLGSPADQANAEWLASQLRSWGWHVTLERFDVLFPVPVERLVELAGAVPFRAHLNEREQTAELVAPARQGKAEEQEPGPSAEELPGYHAYSADGDVSAPLVYVNRGIPEDYLELERRGISVRGKIVIARYGGSWRGIKPKVAAEHGAIGCLVYSDPADDGYAAGDVFPRGAYRPPHGVQRGSVLDIPLYPGDPLTPGAGATEGTRRLDREQAASLMRIPVLPISYADARPLLESLDGPVVPAAWRGALPVTYHFGPGRAPVRLKLRFDWKTVPVYNVIARIPGSEAGSADGDQWIIRGNHHDAWVYGAEDPLSAAAPMLEEARAIGALVREGWKPRRSILYCFWDGEEQGLMGSTEWAEAHAEELQRHAAVYLNSDNNGRGRFEAGGSHTLARFINGVMRDVLDPETGRSIHERAHFFALSENKLKPSAGRGEQPAGGEDLPVEAVGSGSDYTPFLDHLGIPSLTLGFGGEDGGGIYHSIHDNFYWYTHFSDTDFAYGRALAQTAGTAVIRLAGANLLPFEFQTLSRTIGGYLGELKTMASQARERTAERNQQISDGMFAAIDDPRRPLAPPKQEPVPPFFNFAPLDNAVAELDRAARVYADAFGRWEQTRTPAGENSINGLLMRSEQALTDGAGLPGRPWYRHLIYAPGFYTGYGVKTLPGVREALEQKQWSRVDREISRAAQAVEREAHLIQDAAQQLAGERNKADSR